MSRNTIKLEIIKTVTDEEGEYDTEVEVEFPAKWGICQCCEGEGRHSNPSIDGNGITSSEWAEWHPDEREDYLSGAYDVACEEMCQGGKVLVVNEELLSEDLKKDYQEWQDQEEERARSRAEDARTRRMESGGYEY